MWCPKCYTSDNNIDFHIYKPNDLFHQNEPNPSNIPRLQEAWAGKVRSKNAFQHGRRGDHLVIPFECDFCIFQKLKNHLPRLSNPQDVLLLAAIRRMNLDAFWSREIGTIEANAGRAERMINMASTLGLPGPFIRHSSLPLYDHCGYQVAVTMLLLSRRPGKHSTDYTQYG